MLPWIPIPPRHTHTVTQVTGHSHHNTSVFFKCFQNFLMIIPTPYFSNRPFHMSRLNIRNTWPRRLSNFCYYYKFEPLVHSPNIHWKFTSYISCGLMTNTSNHILIEKNMFSEKTVFTIVKVVMIMVLTLFIVNSKPVETTRLFVAMKSNKLETVKVVPVSQVPALVPPSAPNPCTYLLPGPGNGSGCHHHWR